MSSDSREDDDTASESSQNADSERLLTLKILSPSTELPGPLILRDVPESLTVGELRHRIRQEAPTRPGIERQRLIHLGRMLGNADETLVHVFGRGTLEHSPTQVLHLVLSPSAQTMAPPVAQTMASSMAPTRSEPIRFAPQPMNRPSSVPPSTSSNRARHQVQAVPNVFPPRQGHAPAVALPSQGDTPRQVQQMLAHLQGHAPVMVPPAQGDTQMQVQQMLAHLQGFNQRVIPPNLPPLNNLNPPMPAPHTGGQRRVPSPLSQSTTTTPAPTTTTRTFQQFQHHVGQQQRARAAAIMHGTGSLLGQGEQNAGGVSEASTDASAASRTSSGLERESAGQSRPVPGFHSSMREYQDRNGQTWQVTVTENHVPVPSTSNSAPVAATSNIRWPFMDNARRLPGFTPGESAPLPGDPALPVPPRQASPRLASPAGGPTNMDPTAMLAQMAAMEMDLRPRPPNPPASAPNETSLLGPTAWPSQAPPGPNLPRQDVETTSHMGAPEGNPSSAAAPRGAVLYTTALPRQPTSQGGEPSNQPGEPSSSNGQTSPTTFYLLSSPGGPWGILLSPSGIYQARLSRAVRAAPAGLQLPGLHLRNTPSVFTPQERAGASAGPSGTHSSMAGNTPATAQSAHHASSQTLQPQPPPQGQAQGQPQVHAPAAQQGPQQRPPQEENQLRDLLRLLLPIGGHLWLFIRLLGFVFFFTNGSGWRRTFFIVLSALMIFIAQAGLLDGVRQAIWAPVRRHLEGILPLADAAPPPQRNRPRAGAGAGAGPADAPAAEQQRDPAAAAAAAAAAATRLTQQRARERPQGWLYERVRAIERAVLIFLASLVPGVGERHIAARDAAAVAALAAAAAAAAEAAEAEEAAQQNNRTEQEPRPNSAEQAGDEAAASSSSSSEAPASTTANGQVASNGSASTTAVSTRHEEGGEGEGDGRAGNEGVRRRTEHHPHQHEEGQQGQGHGQGQREQPLVEI